MSSMTFHARGMFERSLNTTFMALILEKPGAVDIKAFRPISLLSGVYKIVAKVFANMLKIVLEKIISKSENAFIRGRKIQDFVLIADQCLDSRIIFGEPDVLCKLDIKKAYDRVNWGFLLYVLRRCSFGEKWCNWIANCISLVHFYVLVNISTTGFFK
jgi:hypothetical protein